MAGIKVENGKIYIRQKKEQDSQPTSPSVKVEDGKMYMRVKKGEDVDFKVGSSSNASDVASKAMSLLKNGFSDVNSAVKNSVNSLKPMQTQTVEPELSKLTSDYFKNMTGNADYAEKSAYKSTRTGDAKRDLLSGYYFDTGYGDLDYEMANKNNEARLIHNVNRGENALEEKDYLSQLNEKEVGLYNYIYNTKGKDEANKYINEIKSDLYKRQSGEEQKTLEKMSYENPLGMGLVRGLMYPAEAIEGAAQQISAGLGNKVDANDPLYSRATKSRNVIIKSAGDSVEANYGIVARKAFDLANVAGDMAIEAMFGKVGGAVTAGLSASSQSTLNALDRGVEPQNATNIGVISGLVRGALRYGALKGLFKTDYVADYSVTLPKVFANYKFVLKNAGNFALASVFSDTTNVLTDTIFAGDKSNFNLKVQNYISQGMDQESAVTQALTDTLVDMANNAANSAITGGIFAMIMSAGRNVSQLGETINDPNRLIEEAKPQDPTGKLIDIATNMYSDEPISEPTGVDIVNPMGTTELAPFEPNAKPQGPVMDGGIKLPTSPVTSVDTKPVEPKPTEPKVPTNNEPIVDDPVAFPKEDVPTNSNPYYNNSEKLAEFSDKLQENGKYAITKFYNDNIPVEEYGPEAMKFYMAGFSSKEIESVDDSGILNDAQKQAMYEAGRADAQKYIDEFKNKSNGNTEVSVKEEPKEEPKAEEPLTDAEKFKVPSTNGRTFGQLTPEEKKAGVISFDNDEDYKNFIEYNYVLGNGMKTYSKKEKIADFFENHTDTKDREVFVSNIFRSGVHGEQDPLGMYKYNFTEEGLSYSFGGDFGFNPTPEHHTGLIPWTEIVDTIDGALKNGTFIEGRLPIKLANEERKEENEGESLHQGRDLPITDTDRKDDSGVLGGGQTRPASGNDSGRSGENTSGEGRGTVGSVHRSDGQRTESGSSNGDSNEPGLGLTKINKRVSVGFDKDVNFKYIPDTVTKFLKDVDKLFKDYELDKTPTVMNHSPSVNGIKGESRHKLNFYYSTKDESVAANVIPEEEMKALVDKYAGKSGINFIEVKNSSNLFVKSHHFRKDGDIAATYNVLIGWNVDSAREEMRKKEKKEAEKNRKEVPGLFANRKDITVSTTEEIPEILKNAINDIDNLFKDVEIAGQPKYDVWEHVENLGPRYTVNYYTDDTPYGFEELVEKYKDDSNQLHISVSITPNFDKKSKEYPSKLIITTKWAKNKPPKGKAVDPAANKTEADETNKTVELANQEKPRGNNFVITDDFYDNIPTTEAKRYAANVEAIKVVKTLQDENRYATPDEQKIIANYTGWGGITNSFYRYDNQQELKRLLTEDEFNLALSSILDSYYTEPSIIKGMYNGLRQLGFEGGKMLEPSTGVGRFFGLMPSDMATKVTSQIGVEMESISGNIAKYLYPNSDIRVEPFQKAKIPDNFVNLVVGNVPFGSTGVYDPNYPKYITSKLHNYFIAKSIDITAPGGITCLITSSTTLDSNDMQTRRYFADKADLIGAIRLPSGAFKGTGTDVVTDILVFKKRLKNELYSGEKFQSIGSYNGVDVNEYFENHPDMILGELDDRFDYRSRKMVSTVKANPDANLSEEIEKAFSKIQTGFDYTKKEAAPKKPSKPKPHGSLTVKDGVILDDNGKEVTITKNENGNSVEKPLTEKQVDILSRAISLKDKAKELLELQKTGADSKKIELARKELNKLYDDFKSKYKGLHYVSCKSLIKKDKDAAFIFSLEKYKKEKLESGKYKEIFEKSDIFFKDVVSPRRTVQSVSNIKDGIVASMNMYGYLDTQKIADMLGTTTEEVIKEFHKGYAYKIGENQYQIPEIYLSGNVKAKLNTAESMVPYDKEYEYNVKALKKVIPADIKPEDINVAIGSTWIPESIYSEFAASIMETHEKTYNDDYTIDVKYNPLSGSFDVEVNDYRVKNSPQNNKEWGTADRPFIGDGKRKTLFECLLNNEEIVVKRTTEDKKTYIDKEATELALNKAESIKSEFIRWLWSSQERRQTLGKMYNDIYNNTVIPHYDGSDLEIEGLRAGWELKSHQKNVVKRILYNGGNTLIAHRVGAGKTLEMATAAMKLRQLGVVKKPVICVPKHLLRQWGKEFNEYYPDAKVYVVGENDFTKENKAESINRILTGDYDAIIMHYENFYKIPMNIDYQREFFNSQIEILNANMDTAKKNAKRHLAAQIKTLQARLDKINDEEKKDNRVANFDELGIDALFVDEAHNFKNLFLFTNMGDMADISQGGDAARASDMYMKTSYLQKLNGGRGLVFATATPIMNSVAEAYTMQRYLQEDTLRSKGIVTFDAWAKQFGDPKAIYRMKFGGQGYELKQSMSSYKNLPEFQQMWQMMADVLIDVEDLPDIAKKIPKIKGGERIIVECEPTTFQKKVMAEVGDRAEHFNSKEDSTFAIMHTAKSVAYSGRLIDPEKPIERYGKIGKCADNVYEVYKKYNKEKAAQLIFCDRGVHGGNEVKNGGADLYMDLKEILVEKGIPANEIAFINDYKNSTSEQKLIGLFNDVNSGKIRVLIGSSAAMSTGVNVQERLVAIHEVNPVDRPGDLEQMEGRGIRQGNIFKEVEIYVYVTKGSFDSRQWDAIKRKSTFINQIMSNTYTGRTSDVADDLSFSAAEISSVATGNPAVLEMFKTQDRITKLKYLQGEHKRNVRDSKNALRQIEIDIPAKKEIHDKLEKDLSNKKKITGEDFNVTIKGKKYTTKKEGGDALLKEIKKILNLNAYKEDRVEIGEFAGFKLSVSSKGFAYINGELQYSVELNLESAEGSMTRLQNLVEKQMSNARLESLEADIDQLEANKVKYKEISESSFDGENELIQLQAKLAELQEQVKQIKLNAEEVEEDEYEDDYYDDVKNDVVASDENRYLKLAEDPEKNDKELRKIVDNYAFEHGARSEDSEPIHYYHGTHSRRFNTFNPEKSGGGWSAFGYYFTENEDFAEEYKYGVGSIYDTYLMTDNLAHDYNHKITLDDVKELLAELDIPTDSDDAHTLLYDYASNPYFRDLKSGYVAKYKNVKDFDKSLFQYPIGDREIILRVERLLDGIGFSGDTIWTKENILKKVSEWSGYDGVENLRETVLFDNKYIKLADTVTYDDDGNVIPLSKRFDTTNDDVRKAFISSHEYEWKADRIGEDGPAMSLADLFAKFMHDFGLDISAGGVRGKGVLGTMDPKDMGIRTRSKFDLPTLTHEFGHWLDRMYNLTKKRKALPKKLRDELIKCFENSGLDQNAYKESEKIGEGFAEWAKLYLRHSTTAANEYPEITKFVLENLSVKDRELLEFYADEINKYYSKNKIGDVSMMRSSGERPKDPRTTKEKIVDFLKQFYQDWFDSNSGIKHNSHNAYVIATNSAYASKISANIIENALTDINGAYVGKSLVQILEPIDLSDKEIYKQFNKYLVDIHGPERLAQGKKVYENAEENNVEFMKKEREYFEELHPEWKKVAEEIFEFEDKFMNTWAVGYGVISAERYEAWKKMYEHHVPLKRMMDYDDHEPKGTRNTFANQSSPVKRTKYAGSGRDIINPIENLIDEVARIVNVAYKNNVMLALREDANDGKLFAPVMSRWITEKAPHAFSTAEIKAGLQTKLENDLLSGEIDGKQFDYAEEMVSWIKDVYLQFEPKRADIKERKVTILVNGREETWKINDPFLFNSIINLNPTTLPAILRSIQATTRFMTSMITGSNPLWSIFSNAPRDVGTLSVYTQFKGIDKSQEGINKVQAINLIRHVVRAYADNFMGAINKGWNSNPYHKEYLAMGGGESSLYSADVDSMNRVTQKLTQKGFRRFISNLNPLQIIEYVTNAIESGPREATYIMCREFGMTPQEAFYNSRDITVNFAKGGKNSRTLNIFFPFFNASMQGIDKFARWITADDIFGPGGTQSDGGGSKPPKPPKKNDSGSGEAEPNNSSPRSERAKVIGGRIAWFVGTSIILAGLIYLLNNKDEESEKEYEQLSTYIKNSYYCIPIGNGRFVTIPKPRELAVLTSLFETTMERVIGENENAFDDFYGYALDQFLPSVIADLFKLPENVAKDGLDKGLVDDTLMDMLGDAGILGVFINVGANRDFLGRPIVSTSLQEKLAKDQFTGSNSKLSKLIGEALNLSPQRVDYIMDQLFGYYQKINKALFPVDEDKIDPTLGIKNTYVRDNQFSTDLINRLYDEKKKSATDYKSSNTAENYIKSQMDSRMTDFYSKFNALNKLNKDETTQRANKQAVYDMVSDYLKETSEVSAAQKIVYDTVKSASKYYNLLPKVMPTKIKDYELNDTQYYEYQTRYNNYYYSYIESAYRSTMSDKERQALVIKANDIAKDKAENDIYSKYQGTKANNTFDKYQGISPTDMIRYQALVQVKTMEDGDNGITQQEKISVIDRMVNQYGLSRENARKLFKIAYPNSKVNPY